MNNEWKLIIDIELNAAGLYYFNAIKNNNMVFLRVLVYNMSYIKWNFEGVLWRMPICRLCCRKQYK